MSIPSSSSQSRDRRAVRRTGWLAIAALAMACAPATPHATTPPPPLPAATPSPLSSLSARLADCDLLEMATGLAASAQVAALWHDQPDARLYTQIVEDAARPLPARFAAALMLRSKSAAQLRRTDRRALAEVLTAALQRDLVGYAYPWGRLWAGFDPLGLLGQLVVELGRPAIPALVALLDDTSPRDSYRGREEATDMAMRQYRVKDFAAFYLSRIAGLELPWHPELADRDQAIDRLRAQLAAAP